MTRHHNKDLLIAWVICGLGAIYYAYEYFLRIEPSVMEHALRHHFNLSATGFGLLSAFYYYAYVPMQLPVGVLMDRFGPRRLLTIACGICVIGTFTFAATTMFNIAAAGRFLVGLGSAFAFVGVLKLATIWLPEDKLGMASGLATALGTIGAMFGDNILGALVKHIGWQATVNLSAIFGIGLTLLLMFSIKDRKKDLKTPGTITTFKQSFKDLAIILRNRLIWLNGMYGCLVYLPTTVFAELWGISYLRNAHGLSHAGAELANSLLFLGFTIGAPTMGFISDKLHRRKLPMLYGGLGAGLIMTMIIYMPNLDEISLDILLFLLGLLYSVQALVFAVGREVSPKEAAGTAIAATNMIVMIGAMLLQPFFGSLLDYSQAQRLAAGAKAFIPLDKAHSIYNAIDYQFAITIIPIGMFIAVILTFFIRETYAHATK